MKSAPYNLRTKTGLWIVIIGLIPAASSLNLFAADNASVVANRAARLSPTVEEGIEGRPLGGSADPAAAAAPASNSAGRNLTNPITGTIWTALLFVLMIIFVAAWFIRRAYPGGNMLFGSLPVLQVLGRTLLAPKQTLTLVKFDGRLILLGVTDHQINPLLTIDDPAEVSRLVALIEQARPSSITAGFKHLFSREAAQMQRQGGLTEEISLNPSESLEIHEENEVLSLKNELNSLISKVQKLKGIGSQDHSG